MPNCKTSFEVAMTKIYLCEHYLHTMIIVWILFVILCDQKVEKKSEINRNRFVKVNAGERLHSMRWTKEITFVDTLNLKIIYAPRSLNCQQK